MSNTPPVSQGFDALRGDTLQEALTSAIIRLRGITMALATHYASLSKLEGSGPHLKEVETVFNCMSRLIEDLEIKQATVDAITNAARAHSAESAFIVKPPSLH